MITLEEAIFAEKNKNLIFFVANGKVNSTFIDGIIIKKGIVTLQTSSPIVGETFLEYVYNSREEAEKITTETKIRDLEKALSICLETFNNIQQEIKRLKE